MSQDILENSQNGPTCFHRAVYARLLSIKQQYHHAITSLLTCGFHCFVLKFKLLSLGNRAKL